MNFDDFFNAKPVVPEQQHQTVEFKPSPKNGQNGVYEAVIRFLPNPTDPANKSIIQKYNVYLTEPKSKTARTVDCPSTIGQPDPIQNTYFALRNSNNPVLKENAEKFKRKQQFASLIQILKCKSDPTIEGKILIWKYGKTVYDKIQGEMNPPMGEGHNPFNLISGRPFSIQVKQVGQWPNYDSCQFFDLDLSQSGMRVADATGRMYVVTVDTISTPEGKEMVFNYLKNNAPDTTKYEFREWDAETTAFVNECIRVYSDPNATIQAMSAAAAPAAAPVPQPAFTAQVAAQPTFTAPATAAPTAAPSFEMPAMGLGAAQAAPVTPGGFQAPQLGADVNALLGSAPATEKKAAPAMGMSLDDVLNGTIM